MIRKKSVRIIVPMILACLAVAGGITWSIISNKPVQAATEPPAYVNIDIHKVMDGTGWNNDGTPKKGEHTFIQKANGFPVGDESKTDGVIASGDTVEYSTKLEFTAAKSRKVVISFDISKDKDGNVWLDKVTNGTFCSSGQLITARYLSDGSCEYTVPAGVTETLTQTLFFRGKDTGGTVKKSNAITMKATRDGNKTASSVINLGEITVVSAPAADLVIDDGGNPQNDTKRVERYVTLGSSNQNSSLSGYFDIYPYALKYSDWSSLGASTNGNWAADDRPMIVDVSQFPEDTQWSLDGGKKFTASNGSLTLTTDGNGNPLNGNHRLSFTIPQDDIAYSCTAPTDPNGGKWSCKQSDFLTKSGLVDNGTLYLGIQLIPSEDVFASDDNNGTMQNMGTGGEPGRSNGKNVTTLDNSIGSKGGYPYVNNDWSRFIIQRSDPISRPPCDPDKDGMSSCFEYEKTIYAPYTPGKTKFEDENKYYDKAVSERTLDDWYWHRYDSTGKNHDDTVAEKTQIRTRLGIRVLSDKACQPTKSCDLAIAVSD